MVEDYLLLLLYLYQRNQNLIGIIQLNGRTILCNSKMLMMPFHISFLPHYLVQQWSLNLIRSPLSVTHACYGESPIHQLSLSRLRKCWTSTAAFTHTWIRITPPSKERLCLLLYAAGQSAKVYPEFFSADPQFLHRRHLTKFMRYTCLLSY